MAVAEREQRLLDDDVKIAKADYHYVNTGSLTELDAFVGSVLADLAQAGEAGDHPAT